MDAHLHDSHLNDSTRGTGDGVAVQSPPADWHQAVTGATGRRERDDHASAETPAAPDAPSESTAGNAAAPATVRGGGELAARDAAALMLGLASTIKEQVAAVGDVHPDLYRSLVDRLDHVGTELALAHDQHDLLSGDGPPAEGKARAQQLVALLRETPRERHDSPARDQDPASAPSPQDTPADRVTELLDRSGRETFPASDPPSP